MRLVDQANAVRDGRCDDERRCRVLLRRAGRRPASGSARRAAPRSPRRRPAATARPHRRRRRRTRLDPVEAARRHRCRRPSAPACGGDGRRRRLLRRPAAPGRPPARPLHRAAGSRGWPPSATGACGTPATRTRWPPPPTPNRAAAPSWSSATGCRAPSTPTWPAWPAPAPPVTCWPPRTRAAWARPPPGSALVATALDEGDRRGQRRRPRRHGRGLAQPGVLHLRRRRPGRRPARGRLGRRQPRLLAARRGPRRAADGGRLLRGRADRRTACRGTRPRTARTRTPSPAGSASTPPTTRRGRPRSSSPRRAGSWCAPTACGTTAPKRRTSAHWSGRPRSRRRRAARARRCAGRLGQRPGRPRQHHRRPGPHDSAWPTDPPAPPTRRNRPHREEARRWPSSPPTSTRTSSCPTAAPTCTRSSPSRCTGAGEAGPLGRGRRGRDHHRRHLRLDGHRQDRGGADGGQGGPGPDPGRHLVRGDRRQPRGPLAYPAAARELGMVRMDDSTRAAAKAARVLLPRRRRHRDGHLADHGRARLRLRARRDPEARHPADRRDEPARDARGADRGHRGRPGPVPVRLPRRRRRLGRRPRSAASPPRCSARSTSSPAPTDGRGVREADARPRWAAASLGVACGSGPRRAPRSCSSARSSPTVEDITARRQVVNALTGAYPTGSWGDESRDYHVAVRLAAKGVGQEQLAARVQLAVGDQVVAQGLVKALWSDDDDAHHPDQPGRRALHRPGRAGRRRSRTASPPRRPATTTTATAKLGRAVQLAAETGNDEATSRLRKVVDVEDPGTGTVRLRAASTSSTRWRSTPPPPRPPGSRSERDDHLPLPQRARLHGRRLLRHLRRADRGRRRRRSARRRPSRGSGPVDRAHAPPRRPTRRRPRAS